MTEPSARDRELARKIAQEVAEMPGRTSPDDEPDMMFVTQDEIEKIAGCYLAAARAEGMAQGRREAIKDCASKFSCIQHRNGFAHCALAALPQCLGCKTTFAKPPVAEDKL